MIFGRQVGKNRWELVRIRLLAVLRRQRRKVTIITNFDAHLIAKLCLPTFQRQCQPDQTQNSDSEFCILYLFGPFVCLSIFLLLYFGECSWSAGEAGCRCASGFCLSATITLPQKYHTVIILHHIYKYHTYSNTNTIYTNTNTNTNTIVYPTL